MKKLYVKKAMKWLFAAAVPLLGLSTAQAQSVDFLKGNYTIPSSSAEAVAPAWDGNFYFTGGVISGPRAISNFDVLLVKINPAGDTLWKRQVGTPARSEAGRCILTPLSNMIMVAGTADDIGGGNQGAAFLMHFDGAGNLVWQKSYDIPGKRTAVVDMKQLSDGYALCGTITDLSTGNTDAWLLRTDLNGDTLWSKSFGGAGYDDAWQIERTAEGGFMLGGGSYSYTTGSTHDDAWLVKTNSAGEEIWIKHYGNADTVDWMWAMAPVGNPSEPSGYIFTGVKNRNPDNSQSEMFLMRVDTAGNIVWDASMPGNFGYREGLAIEQTFEHSFYVTASELKANGSFSLLAMNIDSNGNVLNELQYNSTDPERLIPRGIYVNVFGDAYVVGRQVFPGAINKAFVAHITGTGATGVQEVAAPASVTVYPNPAREVCTLSSSGVPIRRVVLRDATGRVLRDMTLPGSDTTPVGLKCLVPGFYFVTVYTTKEPMTLRLVVQ